MSDTVLHQFLALAILETLIKTRWKALPADQKQGKKQPSRNQLRGLMLRRSRLSGIRNFVVQTTVEVTSDETTMRKERAYVNKLNIVLVNVSYGP